MGVKQGCDECGRKICSKFIKKLGDNKYCSRCYPKKLREKRLKKNGYLKKEVELIKEEIKERKLHPRKPGRKIGSTFQKINNSKAIDKREFKQKNNCYLMNGEGKTILKKYGYEKGKEVLKNLKEGLKETKNKIDKFNKQKINKKEKDKMKQKKLVEGLK